MILTAATMVCATLTAYDGDTVRCDGQPLRAMGPGAPYLSGFDTPEIGRRARCRAERRLGIKARDRMRQLLRAPGLVVDDSGERDPHGRPLVWLRLPGGITAGEVLMKEGLAREWLPGRKNDWCN